MRYGFGWKLRGPWSDDLTEDVCEIIPNGLSKIENKRIKKKYADILKKINRLESFKKTILNHTIKNSEWYSALAVFVYSYEKFKTRQNNLDNFLPRFNPVERCSKYVRLSENEIIKIYEMLRNEFGNFFNISEC